jgi:uncharacterized protein YqeY
MDLQTRIDQDLKEAMKARQTDRLAVLRMLKSALKNAAIEQGGAEARLDEGAGLAVLRKELKKRHDSIESFQKGHRADLAAKEEAEVAVLNSYLPPPLSPAEVDLLVAQCVRDLGATSKAQMGAVMKEASARAAGRVDGKTLSAAVNAKLA